MTASAPLITPDRPNASARRWRGFARTLVGCVAAVAALAFAFVVLVDPYGGNALRLRFERPLMDVNQRYLYPQIVRRGVFDSAVIGTSTLRLLDPRALNDAFGGRFANLAMNAATPWEQAQLAALFLRSTSGARTLIWGIDTTWCEADADRADKRITFRSFPRWAYDDDAWNDIPHLFNFRTIEIGVRVAAHRVGLMPQRLRSDGFEVFTPPEATYDPERARGHIWAGNPARRVAKTEPPVILNAAQRDALRFPAMAWLDETLPRAGAARIALVIPPVHVAWQPSPGGAEAAREEACKARMADIAARHGAVLLDFRLASDITTRDENYWDPLHYRLPVAERLTRAIADGIATGQSAADGVFVVR